MKKRLLWILIIALIAALLLWRFWPRSLDQMLGRDADGLTRADCNAMISRFAPAGPGIDQFHLPDGDPDEVARILRESEYRPAWRNLLPWRITSVSGSGPMRGYNVNLLLLWDEPGHEYAYMSFLGGGIVTVETGRGMRLYHPTRPEVLKELAEYIQENGEER